jgi:hypothetical protein
LSTETLNIEFHPESMGPYSDILTLCQETDSLIIARQLDVLVNSNGSTGIQKETVQVIELCPNPVKTIPEMKLFKMINSIIIYDLCGRIIKTTTGINGCSYRPAKIIFTIAS